METWDILAAMQELEESGMERSHADAIAATIAAATAPLATKADLAREVGQLECKLETGFKAVDARFEAMDAKFEARFAAVDARFEAMDARFNSIDGKFTDFEKSIAEQMQEFEKSIAGRMQETVTGFKESIAGQMKHMATKAELESLKVWILSSILASTMAIVFLLLRLGG